MHLLIFNLGPTELIIILVIVLLLFGGSRLAGLGKSTGRALKEFKEETKDLRGSKDQTEQGQIAPTAPNQYTQPPADPAAQPVTPPQGYAPQQGGYPQQGGHPQQPDGYSSQPQGGVQQPADRDPRRDV